MRREACDGMMSDTSDAGTPTEGSSAVLQQELRCLNEDFVRALLSGDVEWYRARLTDDFVCIESDGLILDKAAFLRRAAWGSTLASYALEEVTVNIYGDVALVRAKARWTDRVGITGFNRYLEVCIHTRGEWKFVSVQATRMVRDV